MVVVVDSGVVATEARKVTLVVRVLASIGINLSNNCNNSYVHKLHHVFSMLFINNYDNESGQLSMFG